LADFVREIREVSIVRKRAEEDAKSKRNSSRIDTSSIRRSDAGEDRLPDFSMDNSERSVFIAENDDQSNYGDETALKDDFPVDLEYRDTGGTCGALPACMVE
jgi:vacuole morphology and inheritance protein 14